MRISTGKSCAAGSKKPVGNAIYGYMSSEYLVEDAPPESGDQGETGGEEQATTTMRRSDGVYITLVGRWKVTND